MVAKWNYIVGKRLRLSGAEAEASFAELERLVATYFQAEDPSDFIDTLARAEVIEVSIPGADEGIGEAVLALSAAGHRLAVVTAKNEPHARKIIDHLPFGHAFEDVIGATHCGRLSHKPELIAEALQRLGLAAEGAWMIGDRHMDIDGARHHGMRSVGVLWGFGGEDELRAAGATRLAARPAELLDFPVG